MTFDKLGDLLVLILNGAIIGLAILVFRMYGHSRDTKESVAVIAEKMAQACNNFHEQLQAIHREKDIILTEAKQKHENIALRFEHLEGEIHEYQSKFHVRSEDIVKISANLESLNVRVANLQTEVGNFGRELKNGRTHV